MKNCEVIFCVCGKHDLSMTDLVVSFLGDVYVVFMTRGSWLFPFLLIEVGVVLDSLHTFSMFLLCFERV